MLQRVYGTAWQTKEQLAAHEALQKEAQRRDHRKIGKDLDLFSIQQDAGGGLVFWHPKGAQVRSLLEGAFLHPNPNHNPNPNPNPHQVRSLLESYWKEAHLKGGYELLYTPHMASPHPDRTWPHMASPNPKA